MLASAILACMLAGVEPDYQQLPEYRPIPNPNGPATPPVPQLLEVDVKDGKSQVQVWRVKKVTELRVTVVEGKDGKFVEKREKREVEAPQLESVPLAKVNDLTIMTAGGKKLNVDEAEKRIAEGCVVVVSSDGKPVDAKFLKLFRNNVVILVSPEFVKPTGGGAT